jgi:membrane associated rhomboid family serine protease
MGQRLIDRIATSRATFALAVLLVVCHLVVGLVPYARGRIPWWGVLIARRGPRMLGRFGAMRTQALDRGDEFYRLISAAFLHADGIHLLVNVLSLLVVGRIVEGVYGSVRMLWLFFVSAMAGAAASWLLGATITSVGASGGVFGLLGALFIFGWRHRTEIPDDIGRIFRRRVAILVGLNLALGIPLQFIDDYAHIGGLAAGAILATVLSHGLSRPTTQHRGITLLLALTQGVLVGHAIRRVAENWSLY